MKPQSRPLRQRGVTLIEALVAMAVMAFGMLALVGVQATLRINADLARQTAEATKIAEAELESLRSFVTVGSGAIGSAEYDSIASKSPISVTLPDSNSVYSLAVDVLTEDLQRIIKVSVTWKDRYDTERLVVVRDIVSRVAPGLPGLLSAVKRPNAVGLRRDRHPTIPARAGDQIGNNESAFKPVEGGLVAWVFNNSTGVISRVCEVTATTQSSTLVQADLSSCEDANAQLLAGYVRFNLRGVTLNLGTESVYKPIPGNTIAWVIDNSLSRIVRSCVVSAATPTSGLTVAEVPASCTSANASVNQDIATFDASDTASYVLTAADAEKPLWPAMNLKIMLNLDSTGHAKDNQCIAVAPATSIAANLQSAVEYFCIIYPNSTQSWAGKSTVVPMPFADGGDNTANWSIGTGAGAYRVCRYTTASTNFTDNVDHPETYSKWSASCTGTGANACRPVKGNLINQNFLVIDGTKTCPTDAAINPAAGDLVNSNTLPHQP